jgi:hypothetical protein
MRTWGPWPAAGLCTCWLGRRRWGRRLPLELRERPCARSVAHPFVPQGYGTTPFPQELLRTPNLQITGWRNLLGQDDSGAASYMQLGLSGRLASAGVSRSPGSPAPACRRQAVRDADMTISDWDGPWRGLLNQVVRAFVPMPITRLRSLCAGGFSRIGMDGDAPRTPQRKEAVSTGKFPLQREADDNRLHATPFPGIIVTIVCAFTRWSVQPWSHRPRPVRPG